MPANCREARLVMAVDSINVIQYDVILTAEDMVKIGKALQRIGEDQQK